jgi:hypothetical protein
MVNENFKLALDILLHAKDQIKKVLSDADSASVLISIESKLDKGINQLAFLTQSGVTTAPAVDQFPPVTNFMGEDIVMKPAEPVVVDPTEEQRVAFVGKVDNIIASLLTGTLTPELVVKNSPLPEDHLVIRGAAKKLGLADYDTADITVDYVSEIMEAAGAQKLQADLELEAEAALRGNNLVVVTEEILKDNPELADAGVKVGDTVEVPKPEEEEKATAAAQTKKGKGK